MTNTLNDPSSNTAKLHQADTLLAPLFTWRGRDIYPPFGAEGEGDGDGDQDSGPGTDDDADPGNGSDDGGAGTVTREEFDQLRRQLSAADKRREDAEKRLKDIDDAKKDELTKATEQVEQLTKTLASRDKELADMRLQNAFLTANTGITWHDPSDALALAERQGYLEGVVGEDGKVDVAKLKVKLQELAKAKAHLVKDSGGGEEKKKEPKPPTGAAVGSKAPSGNKGGENKLPARYAKFIR